MEGEVLADQARTGAEYVEAAVSRVLSVGTGRSETL